MGDDIKPKGHYAYKDDKRMWTHPDGTKQPYPPKSIGANADNPYGHLQSVDPGFAVKENFVNRDRITLPIPSIPPMPIAPIGPSYTDETEKAIIDACHALAQTLIMKRRDYGKGNIERHGEFGVIVRADDKLSRLTNLYKLDSGEYEPIEDSWKDLAGYAIIGLLFRQGKW